MICKTKQLKLLKTKYQTLLSVHNDGDRQHYGSQW